MGMAAILVAWGTLFPPAALEIRAGESAPKGVFGRSVKIPAGGVTLGSDGLEKA